MKKFSLQLRKKNKTDTKGIIYVRTPDNKYRSTSITIHPKYWNPIKKEIRGTHSDSERLNLKIQDKLDHYKRNYVSDPIKGTETDSFNAYLERHIDNLYKIRKFGNAKKYKTTLNHINSFTTHLKFKDINLKWIDDFKNHLLSKSIGNNTANNYLKCVQKLYRQALKEKVFRTYEDPFMDYSLANTKRIQRNYLSVEHLQHLVQSKIEDEKLYEIRNRFLFQIYGQGLRVSDLFTLRFSNIVFTHSNYHLKFVQYKNKVPHLVPITKELAKCIYFYVNKEGYERMYYTRPETYRINGETMRLTLNQAIIYSMRMEGKHLEYLNSMIDFNIEEHFRRQMTEIDRYAQKYPDKFIVPVLDENLFENVKFNINTVLTKKQVNQISSKTTSYNKSLKRLKPFTLDPNINISSHSSRHSYANLLLESGVDIYAISKSLGHTNLTVTENYVKLFNQESVLRANESAFNTMGEVLRKRGH